MFGISSDSLNCCHPLSLDVHTMGYYIHSLGFTATSTFSKFPYRTELSGKTVLVVLSLHHFCRAAPPQKTYKERIDIRGETYLGNAEAVEISGLEDA